MNAIPIEAAGGLPQFNEVARDTHVDPQRADAFRAELDTQRLDPRVDDGDLGLSISGLQRIEQRASYPTGVDTLRPNEVDGAEVAGKDLLERANELPDDLDKLMQFVLESDSLDPRLMMVIQVKVNRAVFQLESVSKTIEHGMASAKTLMQTQA
jgi:hypothetical protein